MDSDHCIKYLVLFILAISFGSNVLGLKCYECTYDTETGEQSGCGNGTNFIKDCNSSDDVTNQTSQAEKVKEDVLGKRTNERQQNNLYCYESVYSDLKESRVQKIARGCAQGSELPPETNEVKTGPFLVNGTDTGRVNSMYCIININSNDTETPCNGQVENKPQFNGGCVIKAWSIMFISTIIGFVGFYSASLLT